MQWCCFGCCCSQKLSAFPLAFTREVSKVIQRGNNERHKEWKDMVQLPVGIFDEPLCEKGNNFFFSCDSGRMGAEVLLRRRRIIWQASFVCSIDCQGDKSNACRMLFKPRNKDSHSMLTNIHMHTYNAYSPDSVIVVIIVI